jgi:hypothetical protein
MELFMKKWLPVVGYEGLYKVSNLGEVVSYHFNTPKEMKTTITEKGYLSVSLTKDGMVKHKKVHRLVAEAFIKNEEKLPCVNHINEIKNDNRWINLEWCDWEYNNNFGTRNKRNAETRSRPVVRIAKTYELRKTYKSIKDVENDGFHPSSVWKVCNGLRSIHKGYKWAYANNSMLEGE